MSSKFRFEDEEVAGSGTNFIGIAGEDLTNRQLVRIGAAGTLVSADASAAGTLPAIGITLATASAGQHVLVLLKGWVGLATWTWAAGGRIYVSDTAGALTQTAGIVIQEVGVASSDTQIWFDPHGLDTSAGAPAAHATTHMSGGSDETRDMEMEPGLGDETADGLKATVTVGENVVTGDTLYMKADGKYWKADADAGASMPAKVLVVSATIAADAAGIVLHEGYYRNDDRYNWTLGNGEANLLFAHTTAGEIVQLANQPAGAGDQVQVVGWVVDANTIYFRPSLELVEIV